MLRQRCNRRHFRFKALYYYTMVQVARYSVKVGRTSASSNDCYSSVVYYRRVLHYNLPCNRVLAPCEQWPHLVMMTFVNKPVNYTHPACNTNQLIPSLIFCTPPPIQYQNKDDTCKHQGGSLNWAKFRLIISLLNQIAIYTTSNKGPVSARLNIYLPLL